MPTKEADGATALTVPASSLDVAANSGGFNFVSLERNVVNGAPGAFGLGVCSRTGQASPCDHVLLQQGSP